MQDRFNEIDDTELRQLEAEMRDDLRDMREAATVYADRAWSRGNHPAVRAASVQGHWMRWMAASVAAALLAVGGWRVGHHAGADAARDSGSASARVLQPRNDAAVSDEALLNQIQSDLSTGVPAAMEPLAASDTGNARSAATRRSE